MQGEDELIDYIKSADVNSEEIINLFRNEFYSNSQESLMVSNICLVPHLNLISNGRYSSEE